MRKVIDRFLLVGIILLLVLLAPLQFWQSPMSKAFLLLLIFAVKPFLLILSPVPLYVGAMLLFPLGWAVPLVFLGIFINMSVGYLLGRRLGLAHLSWPIKYKQQLERFEHKGKNLCFYSRLFIFPIDAMHVFFGATGLRFSEFVLYTYLGLFPKVVVSLLLGESVSNVFQPVFLFPFAASVCLSAFVFFQLKERTG